MSKMVTVLVVGVMCKQVTTREAMDLIWDPDINTEEHPIHIYDENGREIEW